MSKITKNMPVAPTSTLVEKMPVETTYADLSGIWVVGRPRVGPNGDFTLIHKSDFEAAAVKTATLRVRHDLPLTAYLVGDVISVRGHSMTVESVWWEGAWVYGIKETKRKIRSARWKVVESASTTLPAPLFRYGQTGFVQWSRKIERFTIYGCCYGSVIERVPHSWWYETTAGHFPEEDIRCSAETIAGVILAR